jgi:hypothetical protein
VQVVKATPTSSNDQGTSKFLAGDQGAMIESGATRVIPIQATFSGCAAAVALAGAVVPTSPRRSVFEFDVKSSLQS